MNRPMRKNERQMLAENALNLLKSGEYGIISSVDAEGQPYGVPVNYVFDGMDLIYFHGAKEGHKLDNLKYNPKVSFTVVGEHRIMDWKFSTAYASVIAFGEAVLVDGDEKYQALRLLALKYSPEYMDEFDRDIERAMIPVQVIKIQVTQVTGKERKWEEK